MKKLMVWLAFAAVLAAQGGLGYKTATIALDGNLSAAVELSGQALVAIQMPGTWTTANLTFQGCSTAASCADLYDQYGAEVVVVAAASRTIRLSPADFAGIRFLKVRSGTTGTPVTQTAARPIVLLLRGI